MSLSPLKMESKDEKKKIKKDRKTRKTADPVTEKPHKTKSHSADEVSDIPQEAENVEELRDEKSKKPKKRKRDEDAEDELEINLALPEPPSKKALRKAKKGKASSTRPADDTNDTKQSEKKGEDAEEASEKQSKRSDFGIWIGNLPWSMTKEGLVLFFTQNSEIKESDITRTHMPKPKENAKSNPRIKPVNSGFAYVDFKTEANLKMALELSETPLNGRNVLIKNAKSFEGRPDKAKPGEKDGKSTASGNPPSKRVFVGNLSFDVTRDDLFEHYAPCGTVEDVFLATFEDSGKCKGYGWVTFADVEASGDAVKGFTFKEGETATGDVDADGFEVKKKSKPRKWWVNKLQGRPLRCEFGEDPSVRYKKRYGKDKPSQDSTMADAPE